MSEYIRLYQERQAKRRLLKKVRRKVSPEKYWALKGEIDEIGEQLNQIIKNDARIQAAISMGNQGQASTN